MRFADALGKVEAGTLTDADVRAAFGALLAGDWPSTQIAAFAVALRLRGTDEATLAAAASAMRDVMAPVEHGLPKTLDTCGTGGDGASTINVSTAAAIVVAACGGVVAKHGNRSVSSRCGSADVIEALGIPLDLTPAAQAAVLRRTRIAFLFAPAHHPALRHAASARRELGVRTIFNALGPLANPARATHQLVGVYADELRPVAARALRTLGVARAWVVRSEDGLDEISPAAPTRVSELDGHVVRERVVTPDDFGLEPTPIGALAGGDAADNAAAIERILAGEPHPATAAVVLNAAAALVVLDGDDPRAAATRARRALDEGTAKATLELWRRACREAKEAG